MSEDPNLVKINPSEDSDMTMIYTLIYVSLSGFLVSMVYFVINFVYEKIKRMLICSITIQSSDNIYKMVLDFLIQKGYVKNSMSQMKA